MDELLVKIVKHPQFKFLNQWKQHVNNSMFIIPKWSLSLVVPGQENAEVPETKEFDGSFRSVLTDGAIYLGLELPDEAK